MLEVFGSLKRLKLFVVSLFWLSCNYGSLSSLNLALVKVGRLGTYEV